MATLHFRNSTVYLGSTSAAAAVEVSEARGFTLDIDRVGVEDDGAAGDTWVSRLSGRLSWSGSFEYNFDTAKTTAFDAATQVLGSVRFYGYPDRATAARYYYGFVWVKMGVGGDLDSRGAGTVTFDGDGQLAQF